MELTIPFKKSEYTSAGKHIQSGKIIFELLEEWEALYHNKFNPLFANVIEGHPVAMLRLTQYCEPDNASGYDFGMELIDGEIDIETNLEIEKYSATKTIYAIGSRLQVDEDGDGAPIFLLKNGNLKKDILVLRYDPDGDDEEEREPATEPVEGIQIPH